MKGYMYILKCADGSYYTGSTTNLERRLSQHQLGEGANYTKKRLPVELVYFEEYSRIDEAFYREKQVQGWSRRKKEALIHHMPEALKKYAECMNETHCRNFKQGRKAGFDSAQPAVLEGKEGDFDFAQGGDGNTPALAERSRSQRHDNDNAPVLAERSRSQHQKNNHTIAPVSTPPVSTSFNRRSGVGEASEEADRRQEELAERSRGQVAERSQMTERSRSQVSERSRGGVTERSRGHRLHSQKEERP